MQNNPLGMIQMLSQAQNPMMLLNQMAQSNPQLQQVLNIAQSKTPEQFKQYVQNVCATQNIDINSLAKQFNIPL